MAGAPESYGYPGSVNSAILADWLTRVSGARFSVGGEEDWKVTVQPGLDRGIRINGGIGVGDGVMDDFPDYDTRSLPLVASGSQWFLLAARRNWSTPASTNFVIIPGTAEKKIPAHENAPGQISDQEIALVRIQAGNTVVQDIVDLRAWAGNGGVEAAEVLGRDQLQREGARVKIGSNLHCYEYDAANGGSFAWKVYPLQAQPLQAKLIPVDGTSNANAEVDTFFPAFPNAVTAVLFTDQTFGGGASKDYRKVELVNGRVRWRLYRGDTGAKDPNAGFTVDVVVLGY
ncbi:hypothetical protein [Arthrobacter agilis]|uniref:hypothetical protein n=1 Tax=Arthrobacter agilis TaxID=37921 RepID=UPI002787344F|nr:hypothetical protein [Arthrobacter agilis]MDQ0735338.1 hypothetical protein [Arthrobacter agilis]